MGQGNIVILTGAGISAESGLGTFRDEDGLWARHAIEDVATPEGFARDPGHMHGTLAGALCHACDHRWTAPPEMTAEAPCPACSAAATRPDVVWFGEIPYGAEVIDAALATASTFVSIGTSGQVYPAAAYAQHCHRLGAHTVELNLEPSRGARDFDERAYGPASEVVPAWVDRLLGA